MHSVLIAPVHDTDAPVLEALHHELLHGCAEIVDKERNKNEESVQTMSRINMDTSSKIARMCIKVLSIQCTC